MSRTLLACFAHPDDESFGTGGVLSRYSSEGIDVHLVCTTFGEEGEISDPALATPESLGEVRRSELEASVEILGLKSLELYGYRDSGMAGTLANENPLAYVQAKDNQVVPRLVETIRRLKPSVVITFDPGGAYGHPDHIAVHKHTFSAVVAAGNDTLYPEGGPAWTPDRLFFTAIPRSGFSAMLEKLKASGADTSALEREDMPIPGQSDDEIDVVVDVAEFLELKMESMRAHKTQFGADNPINQFPKELTDEFMSTECFTLGWGKPLPEKPSTDLFAGL